MKFKIGDNVRHFVVTGKSPSGWWLGEWRFGQVIEVQGGIPNCTTVVTVRFPRLHEDIGLPEWTLELCS